MDTVTISIDLPEATVRELDALAESRHCSRAELVQRAVDRIVWQARAAAIPADDEELTPKEEAGIAEGLAEIERGQTVPWEEVKRKLFARNL
jgi:predicted transcriptional regulator